jgi:hypothetical protein
LPAASHDPRRTFVDQARRVLAEARLLLTISQPNDLPFGGERPTNLVSVFCILSWRIFWMTMLNRSAPDALPTLALTATEIAMLDRLVSDKLQARRKTLSHYLTKIARLGGYLARANDPPPGNTVMWRGLSRPTDIALGAMIGAEIVGN